jgi:hypothetical protein
MRMLAMVGSRCAMVGMLLSCSSLVAIIAQRGETVDEG